MDDDLDRILILAGLPLTVKETLNEKSPPGFEGTVKALKKHKEIDNPWALSWYMKNKGYHSHKTKSGKPKRESVDETSDVEEPTEVEEKWDTDYETPESKKGMWKGWSKERLEKRRNALRKKETRTPAETTTLRQINFALRAKSNWGKA